MLLAGLISCSGTVLPAADALRDAVRTRQPRLLCKAFAPEPLGTVASEISQLPLASFDLVKAFDARNAADQFASLRPPIQWACERDGCGRIFDVATTLDEALARIQAPCSARVATVCAPHAASRPVHPRVVAPSLRRWLEELDATTLRPHRDADVYVTRRPFTSASLGWHVDDIDVLLVMMRGSKRFRVAGEAVGSATTIDHTLQPGDAIYIPSLTFHSGGLSDEAIDSDMLSVALPWDLPTGEPDLSGEVAAAESVGEWRAARRALLASGGGTWEWAGSAAGAAKARDVLGRVPAWARFSPKL